MPVDGDLPSVQQQETGKAAPQKRGLHLLFELGIIIKGIDGALEMIAGVLILFVNQSMVDRLIEWLAWHDLPLDRNDYLNDHLSAAASHFSTSTEHFVALYLLLHGVIKVGLFVALQRKILWAYPIAVAVLLLFVCYQFYRWTHTHATALLVFGAFDCAVSVMVWSEYKRDLTTARAKASV